MTFHPLASSSPVSPGSTMAALTPNPDSWHSNRARGTHRIVVVGGGTAGCVIASRLSENSNVEVVLLEEGRWLPGAAELDISACASADGSSNEHSADSRSSSGIRSLSSAFDQERIRSWAVQAPRGSRSANDLITGRVVGGSGRINGGYFVVPPLPDLETWAALIREPDWSTDFRRALVLLESDVDFGDEADHGADGPIAVSRDTAPLHPASEAFADAASELGFAPHPDLNDGRAVGIGPVPFNALRGIRSDPSEACLGPVLYRRNLVVLTESRVRRIITANGQARGVHLEDPRRLRPDGSLERVRHGGYLEADQVIVCAGAIGSPQLLLASGIGPPEDLRGASQPVTTESNLVGRTLWNHPVVDLFYTPFQKQIEMPFPSISFMQLALHTTAAKHGVGAEYMATRIPYGQVSGLEPTDDRLSIRMTLMDQPEERSVNGEGRALRILDHEGRIALTDRRGDGESQRKALRHLVRTGLDIIHSKAFDCGIRLVERSHGPSVSTATSNEALDDWVEPRVSSAFHMMGTCPMGVDAENSVVDSRFRVHGIDRLHIADASVIPLPISRGPAATVMVLAEMAAYRIGRSLGTGQPG